MLSAVGVACLAGPCAPAIGAGPPPAPLDIGDEPVLFLDDWAVETSGLKRVLHRPDKKGLIREADGTDWRRGDCYAAEGCAVVRDKAGRFHMTYRYTWPDPGVRDLHPSIGEDKAHWFRQSVGYATSADGVRWHKPNLRLVEAPARLKKVKDFPFEVPDGTSRDNNLGYPIDFALDLHANGNVTDPKRRFLLRVARRDDSHPFARVTDARLYFAEDWPDVAGDPRWEERLTPVPGGRLSPRGFRSLAGYDHEAKVWFQTCQDRLAGWVPRGGRDIARYTSPDLAHWDGPELVLPVARDESRKPAGWVEYMSLTTYRVGGAHAGAWLGQLDTFHGDRSDPQFEMPTVKGVWRKGTVEQRLVLSRDAGKTWARVGGKEVWLPHHADAHGFDRLAFASVPVRVNDELWFYYPAWDGDHLVFQRDGSLYEPEFVRTGRTARATLRYDGYVSLDAAGEAELVTKVVRFRGDRLGVNLRSPGGSLRVEVQDPSGKPLPGLGLADSVPTRGDGVDLAVGWRDPDALARLSGKAIRVRFVVTNGSLYSFRFRPSR